MAKRDIYLVLALGLCALFFWYWASLGYPAQIEVCEETNNAAQPQCAQHYFFVAIFRIAFVWVEKSHDVLLVLGTFALAGVVIIQIRDGRKSSERQLRAYVCVTRGIISGFAESSFPEIIIWAENCGQTPAIDCQSWVAFEADVFPRKKPFKADWEFKSHKSVIGPGKGSTVFAKSTFQLHARAIADVKAKNRAIWGYGEIRYLDVFGRSRYTKYRMIFDGNDRGAMKNDAEGNEAT